MPTDLGELVRARLAVKIEQGKSPSKADLAWLEATQERPPAESSVELSRNAKGETQIATKVYAGDPLQAEATAREIFARLRGQFPMLDGTVGGPMVEK
jgi:hypothetical protein